MLKNIAWSFNSSKAVFPGAGGGWAAISGAAGVGGTGAGPASWTGPAGVPARAISYLTVGGVVSAASSTTGFPSLFSNRTISNRASNASATLTPRPKPAHFHSPRNGDGAAAGSHSTGTDLFGWGAGAGLTLRVAALAAGLDTGLAAAFAAVTMFDAAVVRRATGQQARILNQMLDEIVLKHRISERRLKELLGHTRLEVFVGMLVGIACAILTVRLWPR